MRFYNQPHNFYCGIDLHARSMYLCIRDQTVAIVLHQNLVAQPDHFLKAIEPYRGDLVVGCECMFAWYWVAHLCAREKIAFVLGHALYLKAIHGDKTKNDKLSALLRGNFPVAYVYPQGLRKTRDSSPLLCLAARGERKRFWGVDSGRKPRRDSVFRRGKGDGRSDPANVFGAASRAQSVVSDGRPNRERFRRRNPTGCLVKTA